MCRSKETKAICMWYLCTGAFAASLYASQDLTEIAYDECKMRQQLISCIEVGDITLFPHEHVASNTADKVYTTEQISVYYVCRLINSGPPMIQCSECKEWFHTTYVSVTKKFITNKKLTCCCDTCKK